MKSQIKLFRGILIGMGLVLILVSFMSFTNSETDNEVGTYQISTCPDSDGSMVYETIIDTRTGEVISRTKVGVTHYDRRK